MQNMEIEEHENIHRTIESSECENCTRARTHARRHGVDEDAVEWIHCVPHRLAQKCAMRFNLLGDGENPANTRDITMTNVPDLPTQIGRWEVINEPIYGTHVVTSRGDAGDLFIVQVARLVDDQYIYRHPAVLVRVTRTADYKRWNDQRDRERDTFALLHDDESVHAVAVAAALCDGWCRDTCTNGEPVPPLEPEEIADEYVQRSECDRCP